MPIIGMRCRGDVGPLARVGVDIDGVRSGSTTRDAGGAGCGSITPAPAVWISIICRRIVMVRNQRVSSRVLLCLTTSMAT